MVLYIAEIADDDIRGKLGTSYQLSRSFGVLLAYGQGMVMNYIEVSTIYIAISILFAISFFFVPATPQYLLRIGANEVSNSLVLESILLCNLLTGLFCIRKQKTH